MPPLIALTQCSSNSPKTMPREINHTDLYSTVHTNMRAHMPYSWSLDIISDDIHENSAPTKFISGDNLIYMICISTNAVAKLKWKGVPLELILFSYQFN